MQNLREHATKSSSNKSIDISVGDIVILKNDQTCRNFWKLAKIKQVLPGADGVIRPVIVEVLGGKYNEKVQLLRRSIQYLLPLEVKKQTTEERALSKSEEKEPSTTVSSND